MSALPRIEPISTPATNDWHLTCIRSVVTTLRGRGQPAELLRAAVGDLHRHGRFDHVELFHVDGATLTLLDQHTHSGAISSQLVIGSRSVADGLAAETLRHRQAMLCPSRPAGCSPSTSRHGGSCILAPVVVDAAP